MIHLSAPLAANIGGSNLSSQVMVRGGSISLRRRTDETQLLGREYYQGKKSEGLLVLGPLALHIVTSLIKRAIHPTRSIKNPSLATKMAYPLLLLVPIHIATHKIIPSDPSPPILALSPSELNFEFVKAGLQGWKLVSWVSYMGLVTFGLMHATEGWAIVWRTWTGRPTPMKMSTARKLALGLAAGVIAGLGFIFMEEPMAGRLLMSRINAVFSKAPVYSLTA